MEAVDACGLKSVRITPELDQKCFTVQPEFYGLQAGQKLRVSVKDGDRVVSKQTQTAATPLTLMLPLKTVKTWSPGSPFLYDIELEVLDAKGKVIDHVNSYAGMRKVHIEGNKFFLNNELQGIDHDSFIICQHDLIHLLFLSPLPEDTGSLPCPGSCHHCGSS